MLHVLLTNARSFSEPGHPISFPFDVPIINNVSTVVAQDLESSTVHYNQQTSNARLWTESVQRQLAPLYALAHSNTPLELEHANRVLVTETLL